MTALRVAGALSAELERPEEAVALLVLAHGAGADFRHRNMLEIAAACTGQRIATLRFNFPFMEQGRRRVDSPDVSVATIRDALELAADVAAGLPVYLGGHSFGGRMATHAAAGGLVGVRGLVLCSFPLHPPGKPDTARAAHLPEIAEPMLFLSGTRDALAERDLLQEVVGQLGERARLHWLDTADHSYKVLKRQRQSTESVFQEMGREIGRFVGETA